MAVDAEELVIRPFREVVQRGNEASKNAEEAFEEEEDGQYHDSVAKRLAKAGQILRKEGERALKRLQPLWDDQAAKHGEGFQTLMADSDEIAEKRRTLDDLLYDFEDFIEVDTFDETRCGELQAATKSLALAVIETIRRAKVEPPPAKANSSSVFPPLPPLPPLPHSMAGRPESRSSNVSTQSVSRLSLKGKESWPRPPLSRHRNGMQDFYARDGRAEAVPPLPPMNLQYGSNQEKSGADSIVTAMSSPTTPVSLSNDPPRLEMLRAEMERTTILETPPASPDVEKQYLALGQNSSFQDRGLTFVPNNKIDSPVPPPNDGRHDHRMSILDVSTIQTKSNRASIMSNTTSLSSRTNNSAMAPPASTTRGSSIHDTSRIDVPSARASSSISEHGHQIEKWSSVNTTDSHLAATLGYPRWRSVNVNIDPKAKSLCDGARTFRTGGHWEGVRKVGGASNTKSQASEYSFGQVYSSTPVIYADAMAQCRNCEYSHKHSQLSEDFDGSPANFTHESVRYRRRFLYKSHLATSNLSKAYYACVFCAMGGAKIHESDATTFATMAQLFSHLARHPQPLPDVPGVTVLYGAVPTGHPKAADYDINLTSPPSNSCVPEDDSLGFLPVAIAVKDHFQELGAPRLQQPDREAKALQFFSGGRIVGVKFPPQWDGKWCSGWHDGTFGAFPAKVVKLEPPRRKGIQAPEKMESRRSGLARWRFKPKAGDNAGWLDFDKGDSITNLNWDDPEAWYWSGTNSKGRFGIFPSSHIKVESIQDGSLESDTGRSQNKKVPRPSKSIFRLKRTSTAS